jgi:hypothetical protein
LADRVIALADMGRVAETSVLMNELRELKGACSDAAVRIQLAEALAYCLYALVDLKQVEETEALLEELRQLHSNYRDPAARVWLAAKVSWPACRCSELGDVIAKRRGRQLWHAAGPAHPRNDRASVKPPVTSWNPITGRNNNSR